MRAGSAAFGAVNFILFVIKTHNPYVFLVFARLSGGLQKISFFKTLLVWALVTGVIDYHKYRRGCEDELPATIPSFRSPESWAIL